MRATAELDVADLQAEGQRQLKQQPPSERDFEIYRHVTIQEVSTRVAAKTWGLSQTRVMQIIKRLDEFIAAAGPKPGDKAELNKRLFVIQYQASERIRYVLGRMIWALDASLAGTKNKRVSSPMMRPQLSTCVDECRYAMTIGRLSLMHAKLPGNALTWEGIAADSGDGHARRERVEKEEYPHPGPLPRGEGEGAPPKEDCSPLLNEAAVNSVLATDPLDASDFLAELSAEEDLVRVMRNGRRAGPVQRPIFEPVPEAEAAAELTAIKEERELMKRQRDELKRKQQMQTMLLRKLKKRAK